METNSRFTLKLTAIQFNTFHAGMYLSSYSFTDFRNGHSIHGLEKVFIDVDIKKTSQLCSKPYGLSKLLWIYTFVFYKPIYCFHLWFKLRKGLRFSYIYDRVFPIYGKILAIEWFSMNESFLKTASGSLLPTYPKITDINLDLLPIAPESYLYKLANDKNVVFIGEYIYHA